MEDVDTLSRSTAGSWNARCPVATALNTKFLNRPPSGKGRLNSRCRQDLAKVRSGLWIIEATCQSNPEEPVIVVLSGPIGDRVVANGLNLNSSLEDLRRN